MPLFYLLAGKGTFRKFENRDGSNETIYTPHEILTVEHGKRYRMRLISNGVLNCPIQFSVDNHSLTVIATDGFPVKPVTVESLNVFAGERFDVVIAATQPVGSYWIRTRGEADCSVKSAHQEAILRYQGASDSLPEQNTGYEAGRRLGKVHAKEYYKRTYKSNIYVCFIILISVQHQVYSMKLFDTLIRN